ncbi:uncharacterized protein DSM5745_09299 [Aspergillus mulundensis]|uniref:Uncharacterized protein n=1 Tax=Aspergillus mulundensis TaxID=1810919 RepID=A0A3D8R041_9EURO|nr:hypothetical protein DSM5745_09299 [Aspergillus mulundensis]RDW67433.1 hypothetical protein DSM5745_09299 [Aspergillus mulundensis]
MNEIRIAILGELSTGLVATFHRERLAHAEAAHAIASTAGEQTRVCTVDEEEIFVVTKEKCLGELDELHCFEHGSPPDGIVLVYDGTSSHSFQCVLTALEKIVSVEWGPRLPPLDIPPRTASKIERDGSSQRQPAIETPDRLLSCPLLCVAGDTLLAGSEGVEVIPAAERRALSERFGCAVHEISGESGDDVDRVVVGLVRGVMDRGRNCRLPWTAQRPKKHGGASVSSTGDAILRKISRVFTKQIKAPE